ncbi:uncharacterized protein LOC132950747 [Metopolophium dirhodum]|uniref:uncharacterized protein LOC132949013 n=1 Tax=Metopolophium dirhodum TaxID=44670 RepID=UPI00299038DB|nr:uncharacterized protein LOC132949013 [Metopolophium dirhodum]XP_060878272.1 uncharacterized protein LOC132950747 [Metopolophium dirhodum]
MPSSIPDCWDMEHDPTKNTQTKRKQTSSPSPDRTMKKKGTKLPKVSNITDTTGALRTATKATEYACELVQGLADEFCTEELIGPCLSKVAKALEQVGAALFHLSRERDATHGSQQQTRADATTNTDPPEEPANPKICTPAVAKESTTATASKPAAKHSRTTNGNNRRKKTKKPKLDNRTPTGAPLARGNTTPLAETVKQPEYHPTEHAEQPFTLVEKATRKPLAPRPQPIRRTVQRPAAVLVKVGEGKTYADTLRAVRDTAIDFEAMGTHVTAMRKTLKGDLLVELTKGAKAMAATSVIRDKLAENMVGSVVTRLRHTAEVEITDLDEVTTKAEVLAAILKALREEDLPSADDIKITGLWATRDSRQMATATVPVAISRRLTSIRVGWTQCRVRPRRPEPARCYQCHGFGHSTRQCKGSDLSHACRRCGQNGHTQAICTEGDDLCVACDRMKAPRVPHKPGSGACAARRQAISEMNSTNRT